MSNTKKTSRRLHTTDPDDLLRCEVCAFWFEAQEFGVKTDNGVSQRYRQYCPTCNRLRNSMRKKVDGKLVFPPLDDIRSALGRKMPPSFALKSHGHQKVARAQKPVNPKRQEAYRLLSEARAEEDEDTSGLVYLIGETGDDTYVKIGKSTDEAINRAIGMQTGNPRTLYVIATIEAEDRTKLERELHAKFIEFNHRAEWFYRNDAILSEFGVETTERIAA